MGYLYRPKLKSGERSSIWWAKYYVNGRPVREKEREGRVATGAPVLPRVERIRY